MLRVRLLRIVLPLLLLGLGYMLYLSWKPRSSVHSRPTKPAAADPSASEIWFVEYEGEKRTVAGDVDHFEQGDDGSLRLEGIRDLEVHRESGGPWIINAERGDRRGEVGQRLWHFEDRVVFREDEGGLQLAMQVLDIDEAAGEARSEGDIRFEAPDVHGRTSALIYGLRGQPGTLFDPVLDDDRGGRITALEATLWDGLNDVELIGDVTVLQEGERLDAGRLRIWRAGEERIERAHATEGVWGSWPLGSGPPGHVRGEEIDIRFDEAGAGRWLHLTGDALLRREEQSVAAATLVAERLGPDGSPWKLNGDENVVVQAVFAGDPALLRADRLEALTDDQLNLSNAEAVGQVSFEGRDTRAEADRGTFVALGDSGRIELFAKERAKARLSHARMRVAAEVITTDTQGAKLVAERRVEASLLPGAAADDELANGQLFLYSEPIHFVSERLESYDGGARLNFTGSVRGWQGERSLAAASLLVDQQARSTRAEGNVSTRIPRVEQGNAISESEYIQITSDLLTYDDSLSLARYTGNVRVRLAEGWLEAERVEVELGTLTREVREVRAFDHVRLEFDSTEDGKLDAPVSGVADRAVYDPSAMTVMLHGDQSPAVVRLPGKGGGTTTGRVLAYRLDLGTLDVDSGGQGAASIRTSGR